MRRPNQKIFLVTGKGGVGKTAVAAGLALSHARAGKKVLLVELGDKSSLRFVFGNYSGSGTELVTENLWAARWAAEPTLREYILHYLVIDRLVKLFFDNAITQSLIGAAPGLRELSLLGKITSGIRGVGPDLPFEVIVVDGYATGHFKALLMAPVGMARAIGYGPMGDQSRKIIEVVKSSSHVHVAVVSLPEELPMQETMELHSFLRQQFGIVPTLILNKNLELPLSREESLQSKQKLEMIDPRPEGALRFIEYLEMKGQRQERYRDQIRQLGAPLVELPLYLENHWPEILRLMGTDLERLWPSH